MHTWWLKKSRHHKWPPRFVRNINRVNITTSGVYVSRVFAHTHAATEIHVWKKSRITAWKLVGTKCGFSATWHRKGPWLKATTYEQPTVSQPQTFGLTAGLVSMFRYMWYLMVFGSRSIHTQTWIYLVQNQPIPKQWFTIRLPLGPPCLLGWSGIGNSKSHSLSSLPLLHS